MEAHIVWLLVAIVLIVAQLATGTFYLLFLGIAALVGSAVAFLGAGVWIQASIAAICAVAGVFWVQRHRRAIDSAPGMPPLDVGQRVSFEAWTDQGGKRARVRYRDADWEAEVSGECTGQPGEALYIVAVRGNLLQVARQQPQS